MNSAAVYIFDADGVLLDSLDHACKSFNRIARSEFPSLPNVSTKDDMAYVYPGPLKSSLRRFGLSQEQVKKFFELHTAAMRDVSDDVNPFDEVLEGVRRFAYGRSAVVSSAFNETILTTLQRSSAYEHGMFTHIRGRENGKDKAEKIKEVLDDLGVDGDSAIYIGDMVSDILYCRTVPIKIAAVGYGYHPANYLAAFDPDTLLPDCSSLVKFIEEGLAL